MFVCFNSIPVEYTIKLFAETLGSNTVCIVELSAATHELWASDSYRH